MFLKRLENFGHKNKGATNITQTKKLKFILENNYRNELGINY